MAIGQFGDHPPTWRPLDEALHDEERLVDLLNGTGILADGCGNRRDAHRTTLELVDDSQQDLIVDFIETILVDIQGCQGYLCDFRVDLAVALYLRKVSDSP